MTITLSNSDFNALYQLLSALSGKSAIVANKLITQIRNLADEGRAKEIEIEAENYELELLLKGIGELAIAPKTTSQDIEFLTFISSLLKIKGAFVKLLDEMIDKTAKVDIDSAVELDA
jgi:hypothetical protein